MVDNRAESRYEAMGPDGTLAGFSEYELDGDVVVLTHTEVDPAYEGQGIGTQLVRKVLDDIRSSGRQIVPLCPFYQTYLKRHPDDRDLVAARSG